MKTVPLIRLFAAVVLLAIIVGIPFVGKGGKFDTKELANYGTLLSGLAGLLALYLVIVAYMATKEQIRLSQRQSFDSLFFNILQSHRNTVERIRTGKQTVLKEESESLKRQINLLQLARPRPCVNSLNLLYSEILQYEETMLSKDFFDIYYFLLDKSYKVNKIIFESRSTPYTPSLLVDEYFKNTYYIVRQYLDSLLWTINYIVGNSLIKPTEKHEYVRILMNTVTIDELRLFFYFIIWKSKDDLIVAKTFKELAMQYQLFAFEPSERKHFILISQEEDWKAFEELQPTY